MKQLSSLDIHYLVRELSILVDSKIDNVYNGGKEVFYFQVHKSNVGKKILKVVVGNAFFVSETRHNDDVPSSFCGQLRKKLGGYFISSIEQIKPERIVAVTFRKKDDVKKLYLEFFSSGNIVLCDSDDTIITALYLQKFKDRTILHKKPYLYPESTYNVYSLDEDNFASILYQTKKDSLVTFLAIEMGLGGRYAEEVCTRSGVPKESVPGDVSEKDALVVFGTIRDLISSSKKDFSKELDLEYAEAVPVKKSAYEIKLEKIMSIVAQQEKSIKDLEKKEKDETAKAELIYSNYQLINGIVSEINKASKKYSWKEIKEKLKGHAIVKDINSKEKAVVVEV